MSLEKIGKILAPVKLYNHSIKKVYIVALCVVVCLVSIITVPIHTYQEFHQIDEEVKQSIRQEGKEFQEVFNYFLKTKDIPQIQRTMFLMKSHANFLTTGLSDPQGILLASDQTDMVGRPQKEALEKYGITRIPAGVVDCTKANSYYFVFYPVTFPSSDAASRSETGLFWLAYRTAGLRSRSLQGAISYALLYASLIVLLFSLFGIILYRSAVSRLFQILNAIKRFGDGEREIRFEVKGKDEIARIASTLDNMAHTIKQAELLLKENEGKINSTIRLLDQYVITSRMDIDGKLTDVSEAYCHLSGYPKEELLGKRYDFLIHPDMPEELLHKMWDRISHGNVWKGEIKSVKKNKEPYWEDVTIKPTPGEGGKVVEYTTIRTDITDRKKVEAISIRDELTGLFNRRHFNQTFQNDINRSFRDKRGFCFLLLDIDYFKRYNDTYGHMEGDHVLKEIGELLQKLLQRSGDKTFRLGGEEFGIIAHIDRPEECKILGEKLLKGTTELQIEHRTSDVFRYVSISIGICYILPESMPVSGDFIYKMADDELYRAKRTGRNRYSYIIF